MSARYQIEVIIGGELVAVPIPDGFLDLVRTDHARELAAKIRNEGDPASYAYLSGWEWAADLIDPDKE